MRTLICGVLVAALRVTTILASNFEAALDLIVKYHGRDSNGLSQTLESLAHIATRLKDEPQNRKYQSIRLLNKTFWERVGRVDGGIPFMTAMGFDLVEQGAGQGPQFQPRPGAPQESDLQQALALISALGAPPDNASNGEQAIGDEAVGGGSQAPSPGGLSADPSGFNPFATAFSRKSRTHLQERAEQGLINLAERQAKVQQRFSSIRERNVTILLPRTKLQTETETEAPEGDKLEDYEDRDAEQLQLELVAQLWRERMSRDGIERFETKAAKQLRLLRASKMYPYVLLRVRLPGGVHLQARFNSEESLEAVYQVVEASLAAEAGAAGSDQEVCRSFELFLAPPTHVLSRDSTSLKDAKLFGPARVLHLRWESEEAEVQRWAERLEESMARSTGSSTLPRLPYSSRCDVPEAISARRAQDTHAEGFATRADLGAEGVVTDSPHVLPEQADAPPSQ